MDVIAFIAARWPAIVPVLLPFAAALVARTGWSSAAKGWALIGLSAVVGVAGAYLACGCPTPETAGVFIAATYGGAQVAYRIYRANTTTSRWLDRLLALE